MLLVLDLLSAFDAVVRCVFLNENWVQSSTRRVPLSAIEYLSEAVGRSH